MANVLTMEVGLPAARYPAERRLQFYPRGAGRAPRAARRGVDAARATASRSSDRRAAERCSIVSARPSVPLNDMPVTCRSRRDARLLPDAADSRSLRGREFAASDDANPTPGFVVNQAFVDEAPGRQSIRCGAQLAGA